MYDPKIHAFKDSERFAKPGETLYQHMYRVHETCKADPDLGDLTFVDLPAEFKRDYPKVFGHFSDDSLGTIITLVWGYLGGKGTVNDRVIRKWFRDAIGESAASQD